MDRSTRTSRRPLLAASFLAAMALSASAWAYWPWETVNVTSHYDANGSLVGVQGFGDCGFGLVGQTGVSTDQRQYRCEDFGDIPFPF